MQIKFFIIPVFDCKEVEQELNKFLRSNRILEIKQEFVSAADGSFWCFNVKYMLNENAGLLQIKKEKIDYRKILDKEIFPRFEFLRRCRKEIAQNDAVPAYAIFTDLELSEIAKLKDITETAIKTINGIGEKRTQKYGKIISEMFTTNEMNGKSNK